MEPLAGTVSKSSLSSAYIALDHLSWKDILFLFTNYSSKAQLGQNHFVKGRARFSLRVVVPSPLVNFRFPYKWLIDFYNSSQAKWQNKILQNGSFLGDPKAVSRFGRTCGVTLWDILSIRDAIFFSNTNFSTEAHSTNSAVWPDDRKWDRLPLPGWYGRAHV